jgi:hypothetical protein
MNWEEFAAIIEQTSIELYSSEWDQLREVFEQWKNDQSEIEWRND